MLMFSFLKERKTVIMSSAVIICLFTISLYFIFSQNNKWPTVKKISHNRLPPDVETVVNDYAFRNTSGSVDVSLEGKKITRRGVKFLGVRSNVVKSNYFSDIKGSWKFGTKQVEFSAGEGEWDLTLDEPLVLRHNVHITIDGKLADTDDMAKIVFGKGIIKTYGEQGKLYSFEKTVH